MILEINLVFLLFTLLSYHYLTMNWNYWKKQRVPGPEPKLFYGNFPSIYNRTIHMRDDFRQIYNAYKGKTSVVGIFRGTTPDLMVMDPSLIKQVFVSGFSHFVNQNQIFATSKKSDAVVGRHLFWRNDEDWRQARAEITPGLTSSRIKANWSSFHAAATRMAEFIDRKMQNDGSVDARDVCVRYACATIESSIFGIEEGTFDDNKVSDIQAWVQKAVSPRWRLTLLLILAPVFPSLVNYIKVRLVSDKQKDYLIKLFRETTKYREEHHVERKDFLNFLLQLRKKRNLKEITLVSHIGIFLFDGIDSTGLVLSHVLFKLAHYKQVQNKLRTILQAENDTKGLNYESLIELRYLDQVVYETLRHYPLTAAQSRYCTKDFVMELPEGGSIQIPKGMKVYVPLEAIHFDPEYYPQPDTFMPERFDEKGIKWYRDNCLLLTFSEGPRTCFGQKFGLAQLKCSIANLLLKYEIELDPKTPSTLNYNPGEVNLAYKEKVFLNFTPLKA